MRTAYSPYIGNYRSSPSLAGFAVTGIFLVTCGLVCLFALKARSGNLSTSENEFRVLYRVEENGALWIRIPEGAEWEEAR